MQDSTNGHIRQLLGKVPALLARNHDLLGAQDRHASILTVEGNIDFEILITAFSKLYEIHPSLRATLSFNDLTKKSYIVYHADGFKNIPKSIIKSSANQWRKIVTRKLAEQFKTESYLWEITLICEVNSNRHHLIMHLHHSICDGVSTANLWHQLLQIYTNLKHGIPVNAISQDPIPNVAELFATPRTTPAIQPPLPLGEHFAVQVPINRRTTEMAFFGHTLAPLKAAIKARAALDGVQYTVNDILAAALLKANQSCKRSEAEHVELNAALLTCVDLRKYLAKPHTPESLSCMVSSATTTQHINGSSSLWEIAKHYKQALHQQIQANAQPQVDYDSASWWEKDEVAKIEQREHFTLDLAISNIGKTAIQSSYEDVLVKAFNFLTNQRVGTHGIVLNIATIDDTVFCNFTYASPITSKDKIDKLAKNYFRILQDNIPGFQIIKELTDDFKLYYSQSSLRVSPCFLPSSSASPQPCNIAPNVM